MNKLEAKRAEVVREAASWLAQEAWPQIEHDWVLAMAEDLVDHIGPVIGIAPREG